MDEAMRMEGSHALGDVAEHLHDGREVGLDARMPFIEAFSPLHHHERRVPPPLLRYCHTLHSTLAVVSCDW